MNNNNLRSNPSISRAALLAKGRIACLLVALALLTLCGCGAQNDTPAASSPDAQNSVASIEAYVSISTDSLDLAAEKVVVADADGDGALTIYDAIYSAHESAFEGGAASGFACKDTEFGLSVAMLWGMENGGSYGYYVNDAAAFSLEDHLADGDRVAAFAYRDLSAWTDMYTWFESARINATAGESVELKLFAAASDENWQPITIPVEGARIMIDGTDTGCVTDSEGRATIVLEKAGTVIISAESDDSFIVPPVCVADVKAQ